MEQKEFFDSYFAGLHAPTLGGRIKKICTEALKLRSPAAERGLEFIRGLVESSPSGLDGFEAVPAPDGYDLKSKMDALEAKLDALALEAQEKEGGLPGMPDNISGDSRKGKRT